MLQATRRSEHGQQGDFAEPTHETVELVENPSARTRCATDLRVVALGARRSLGHAICVASSRGTSMRAREHVAREREHELELSQRDVPEHASKLGPRSTVPGMQRPLDLGERTVTDLAADWLVEHGTPPAVAKLTGVAYEKAVRTIVVPHLGELPVVAVRREHCVAMHLAEVERPSAANLALVVARMIFAYAEEIGLRMPGSNPVVRIRKHPTRSRKRPLLASETSAMLKLLERAAARKICSPACAVAFQLVLLTGARRDEIMRLRWREIDFGRRVLLLDRHKTVRIAGQKTVPLPRRAVELLQTWRASMESTPKGDAWVFEGAVAGKPICDPWRAWNRVRKAAGLDDVQMRDGRSGWATNAHDAGFDPVAIQNQLGHRSLATTGKYIRVSLDRAREIADQMEEVLRTGKRKAVRR